MSKYLQRFSFSVSYYDKKNNKELIRINKYLNTLNNKQEYHEFIKNDPESVLIRHNYLTNRMTGISHYIGDLFHAALGKYEIKNTAIIHCNLSNYDSIIERNVLGDYILNIGFIDRYYDWDMFLNLSDSDKRQSLLCFIYQSMKEYANLFQLNCNSLEYAYEELKDSDLTFIEPKHLYQCRNRFKLYKTYLFNFTTMQYGILYEDLKTGYKKKIFICEKEHFYGIEFPWLTQQESNLIPRCLEYNGYNKDKNTYEMSFGKEVYSLEIEKLVVVRDL